MSESRFRRTTYSDCGEHILELVDKCDETGIVNIDPVRRELALWNQRSTKCLFIRRGVGLRHGRRVSLEAPKSGTEGNEKVVVERSRYVRARKRTQEVVGECWVSVFRMLDS